MGRGNPRLVAWEGDRTVTFTMEDALISPESFSILSGAGFMDASEEEPIYVHTTQQVEVKDGGIELDYIPATDSDDAEMYVMIMTADGAIDVNKIPLKLALADRAQKITDLQTAINTAIGNYNDTYEKVLDGDSVNEEDYQIVNGDIVYVDYYVKSVTGVKQIDIEAGKFGGSYYLEASTLWRDQSSGDDYPAEFVIPNCKVQSNFTFTMAPTGDPSTFTFTMDAFPEYTRFNRTKKVIAALQIVEDKDTFGKESTTGGDTNPTGD